LDKDVNALNGEPYELIVERAREEVGWRNGIVPVRKKCKANILWSLVELLKILRMNTRRLSNTRMFLYLYCFEYALLLSLAVFFSFS
jgi:hypothetical protein